MRLGYGAAGHTFRIGHSCAGAGDDLVRAVVRGVGAGGRTGAGVRRALPALTASQTALLVAVPVLLGSLARLPMGMLADRFGGRAVFTRADAVVAAIAALVVPLTGELSQRCWSSAFFLGLAGSSFSGRRRLRLALDAARAAGHRARRLRARAHSASRRRCSSARCSPAAFGWPSGVPRHGRAAARSGPSSSRSLARNPAHAARPAGLGAMVARAAREPLAWVLGAFYFLTFGGFVAFSIYLPTLLRDAVRPLARRRRFPRRRLRRARHADAAGRRLARRPDRRRAGAVVGVPRRRRCSRCC